MSEGKPRDVTVVFDVTPPSEIAKKLKQYHAPPEYYHDASFKDVRKFLSDASRGYVGEKGDRLLKDSDMRKRLESALDEITK